MKKTHAIYAMLFIVFLSIVALPLFADEQEDIPKIDIDNPLNEIESFAGLAEAIFRWMVIIAIPLSVIFLIWAGLLFVTSKGNEQKIESAKKVFFWVVIGAMVIVAAWAIAVGIHNSIQTL